jgi:3-mercaptopyruvate sulfurtransferase SseA
MGMPDVLHMEGGYGEWKKAGGATAPRPVHREAPEKKKV